MGRRTESPGFTEGCAGSNVSVFAIGVAERDVLGVTGYGLEL
jgi:hypothetical protein